MVPSGLCTPEEGLKDAARIIQYLMYVKLCKRPSAYEKRPFILVGKFLHELSPLYFGAQFAGTLVVHSSHRVAEAFTDEVTIVAGKAGKMRFATSVYLSDTKHGCASQLSQPVW